MFSSLQLHCGPRHSDPGNRTGLSSSAMKIWVQLNPPPWQCHPQTHFSEGVTASVAPEEEWDIPSTTFARRHCSGAGPGASPVWHKGHSQRSLEGEERLGPWVGEGDWGSENQEPWELWNIWWVVDHWGWIQQQPEESSGRHQWDPGWPYGSSRLGAPRIRHGVMRRAHWSASQSPSGVDVIQCERNSILGWPVEALSEHPPYWYHCPIW